MEFIKSQAMIRDDFNIPNCNWVVVKMSTHERINIIDQSMKTYTNSEKLPL